MNSKEIGFNFIEGMDLLARLEEAGKEVTSFFLVDSTQTEFYWIFQGRILIFIKLSYKVEKEGTVQHSFYDSSITLISKRDKDTLPPTKKGRL